MLAVRATPPAETHMPSMCDWQPLAAAVPQPKGTACKRTNAQPPCRRHQDNAAPLSNVPAPHATEPPVRELRPRPIAQHTHTLWGNPHASANLQVLRWPAAMGAGAGRIRGTQPHHLCPVSVYISRTAAVLPYAQTARSSHLATMSACRTRLHDKIASELPPWLRPLAP